MPNALIIAIVILASINAVVTLLVWRSNLYKRSQKINQTLLIWLLPVLGAVLCASVIWETIRTPGRSQQRGNAGSSIPGIGSF